MTSPVDPLHVINLGKEGTFQGSGAVATHPEDIDAIFKRLRQGGGTDPSPDGRRHLILYFHGGLVSESGGLRTANALMPLFTGLPAYPVFFVWESGEEVLYSDWRIDLRKIWQEVFFNKVLDAVLKFVLTKLEVPQQSTGFTSDLVSDQRVAAEKALEFAGASKISSEQVANLGAGVTDAEARQLEAYLTGDAEFNTEIASIVAGLQPVGQTTGLDAAQSLGAGLAPTGARRKPTMLSAEIRQELQSSEAFSPIALIFLVRSAVEVFRNVVARFLDHSDRGAYCTVVEEVLRKFYLDKVGTLLWDGMKDRTRLAFADNQDLLGDAKHGGTYFLDCLHDYLADHDAPSMKVSLVGHSAGAIYICRFMEKAFAVLPDTFRFNHIVMLAPAVDFDLFKRTVVDQRQRFKAFRMFALLDYYETRNWMLPPIYPRSLLYFVSGLLEGANEMPLVGMERFYSGKAPYSADAIKVVLSYILQPARDRIVWSVADGREPGFNSHAMGHGGFAEEPYTQESLQYLLNT